MKIYEKHKKNKLFSSCVCTCTHRRLINSTRLLARHPFELPFTLLFCNIVVMQCVTTLFGLPYVLFEHDGCEPLDEATGPYSES